MLLSRLLVTGPLAFVFTTGTLAIFLPRARAAALVTNGDFDNLGNVFVNNTGFGSDDLQTRDLVASRVG